MSTPGTIDAQLTQKERVTIMRHWIMLLKIRPDLFITVWTSIVSDQPNIKSLFGLKPDQNALESPSFVRLSAAVETFFHRIIVVLELEDEPMIELCRQLGARHGDFSARGFQPTFWDVFRTYLVKEIEAISRTYVGRRKIDNVVGVWRRLMLAVVGHMRRGYDDAESRKADGPAAAQLSPCLDASLKSS